MYNDRKSTTSNENGVRKFLKLTMLVAILLIFQPILTSAYCKIKIAEENNDLNFCVAKIISSSKKGSQVTYIADYYENLDTIKFINEMNIVTVVSRTINSSTPAENEVYVISNAEVEMLKELLKKLKHESGWRPDAKFIIVLSNHESSLNEIFDILLHYRVIDVIVVNGTVNPDLFTYNPFENNACGKHFDRIKHVKCFEANLTSSRAFYPTRLKNCSFKAIVTDSPPFSSMADRNKRHSGNLGVEQFVMDTLAELEQFEIKYVTYEYPEEFSVVDSNLSVYGPLRLVREQTVDMMMGAMLLLDQRAKVFSYLWGHITFSDELKIVVKKADVVSQWKDIYLEFDMTVWILIMVTYLIFVKLVLLLLRQSEGGMVVLMMMDYLFLHGSKLGSIPKTRWIVLIWTIFAYLISTYYQSSLTSLLAHPSMMYQISSESDLEAFNVEPYLSRFFNRFRKQVANEHANESIDMECDIQLDCLKRVSESYRMYTTVLYSLYLQSTWRYRDARGNYLLYPFKQPFSKIIYAIYFDKGFPLLDKLHLHTLYIKESGILEKYLDDFYSKYDKKGCLGSKNTHNANIFTWHIFGVGYTLSAACFILELIFNKNL